MSESNPNEIYTLNRMAHLTAIMDADDAYYNQDAPEMTDAEYDRLRNAYIERYGTEDLNYVPGKPVEGFEKFTHPIAVVSLDKIKEDQNDELKKRIEKLWPVVHEPKLDGLTVVAYGQPDGSCKFVTRGNGTVGEVLPNFISKYEGQNVSKLRCVRGEVFMRYSVMESINEERIAAGEEPFKNPRNAAAGILRNKERSPYLDKLEYLCYDLPWNDDHTEEEKLQLIKESSSFEPVPALSGSSVDEEMIMIDDFFVNYADGDIPIDGMVIKNNERGSFKKFGSTNHHPNNAFAKKYTPEAARTRLIDIEWQVGRDRLTPVAIMEPVEIDGTMVSKASLHNWGNIKRLKLNRNDLVVVEKSNEIIPQIIRNEGHIATCDMETTIREAFVKPTKCPVCGAELSTRLAGTSKFGEDVEVLYCPNINCNEKIAQNMTYLARKDVLNIEGLSIETARKICNEYDIESSFDIFELSYKDILDLPGFAEKSATKLYDNIQYACEKVPLEKFIPACCILNIGHDIGKKLAAKYRTYDNLIKSLTNIANGAGYEELTDIEGIGSAMADDIGSNAMINAMTDLHEYIIPLDYQPFVTKSIQKQLHIAITGKFDQSRSVYEKMITDAGHVVAKAVSGTTTHLMIADINSTSSKAKKARELGVTLIDEKGLEELLK